MWICAHMCMCAGAHRMQKRVSSPLGLELQVVVSLDMGARAELWSSYFLNF